MKNLNEIKKDLTQTKSSQSELLNELVLKNLKGGHGCPPPYIE